MRDDLKQFSGAALAFLNGANAGQPAATDNSAVNQYLQAGFGDIAAGASQGLGVAANEIAAQEKAAAERARQEQMQKLQDKMDPNKYQQIRKDDGGFEFRDPDGNLIDVSQYSKITGKSRAEILSKSENPLDLQYLNDYSNMQGVIQAINDGDNAKLKTYLRDNKNIDPNSKPEDIMKELIKKYPHIYGNGSYSQTYQNNGNPLFRAPTTAGLSAGGGGGGISRNYGY